MNFWDRNGTKILGAVTTVLGALASLIASGAFKELLDPTAIGWLNIFVSLATAAVGGTTIARGFNISAQAKVASAIEVALKSTPPAVIAIGVGVLAYIAMPVALAGNVTLSWTHDNSPSATCADGSPAAANCAVTGFEVQELINSVWTAKPQGLSPTLRSYTYQNVTGGRHCYRMRAVASGTYSGPSEEVCIDVPPSAPKSPIITVTVAIGSPSP